MANGLWEVGKLCKEPENHYEKKKQKISRRREGREGMHGQLRGKVGKV